MVKAILPEAASTERTRTFTVAPTATASLMLAMRLF